MTSSDTNNQGSPQSLPWYRDAGLVLAAGQNVGRALVAALVLWALAAGTWRAVRAVGGEGKPVDLLGQVLTGPFLGGALLFALGAIAAAMLIVLGSGMIGGALGFLFALPRMEPRGTAPTQEASNGNAGTPQERDSGATPSSSNASMFRPSPALNEIADWLTKIIVGLGLVEATAIGQGFHEVMIFMLGAAGLGRFPVAGVVVPACMLIGLIGGFVAAYLGMTLAISPEIASAAFALETQREREAVKARDEAIREKRAAEEDARRAAEGEAAAKRAKEEAEQAAARAELAHRARAEVVNKWRRADVRDLVNPFREQRDGTFNQADLDFANQPLEQCRTIDERRAWAKLNIAMGRTSAALEAYSALVDDAAMTDFNIAQEAYLLAVASRQPDLSTRFADRARALGAEQPNAVSPESRENLELTRVNAALYEDPPDGFEKATKLLDELAAAMPDVLDSGPYHVYRAAALGQRYAHVLAGKPTDHAATAAIVAAAVPEIIRARELGQGEWLAYLAKPDHAAKEGVPAEQRDDDLVELAKVPEVRQALGLS